MTLKPEHAMRNRKADYAVGFGKPPRHTRFRQGQSGNPKGRRHRQDFIALLERELRAKVTVKEHGGQRQIQMREAIVKQLVAKAASGDSRSLRLLLELINRR